MKQPSGLKLYGIFGHPLSHTLSPVFQEAGFQKAGLLAHYLVFDLRLSSFKAVMRALKKSPLQGFNVTVPYKQTVMPYLDWMTDSAKAIGAVNTVYKFGRKWYGTNTDAEGFWLALKNEWNYKPRGKNVLVLGAGGAARAVLFALAARGVKSITIQNRTSSKAEKLARDFSKIFKKVKFNVQKRPDLNAFDLIINTTSVGLRKTDPALVRSSQIPSQKKCFVDLIYNPAETPFLKLAKKKGHRTMNGLPMLLYQGARAFEIWTGKKAPISLMRKALEEGLKSAK